MWSFLITPTSIFVGVIYPFIININYIPSKPSFNVNNAVLIASSISISALYLFSKNAFAFFAYLPIAVAFQL